MQQIASNINEAIRLSENRRKVLEIQKSLTPADCVSLVEPHRAFVRQGHLTKVCRKTNKRFMFFLFSDVLLYAEAEAIGDRFVFHRMFQLDSCRIEEKGLENVPLSFLIASTSKSFAVFAETQEEKDEWLADLNTQTKNLQLKRESFRTKSNGLDSSADSDLSSAAEAPVWIPDDHVANCVLCQEDFGLLRRRHHCRACGQVVCSKCSDKKIRIPNLDTKNDVRVCNNCFQKHKKKPDPSKLSKSDLSSSQTNLLSNVSPREEHPNIPSDDHSPRPENNTHFDDVIIINEPQNNKPSEKKRERWSCHPGVPKGRTSQ